MSLWSTLGGIGLGITGVGLTIASGGAASPAGAALIGAGASLAKGGMQASAANKAAKQQQKSAQQAIDYSKQQFGKTEANLQPYADMGRGALSQLSYGMGMPAPQPGSGGSMSSFYPTPSGQLTPGMPNQQQAAQSLVSLKAPDGSIMQKPAAEVSYWVQKGAQPVPEAPGASLTSSVGAR